MFEELKSKQSVMWGSGPYERVTANLLDAQEDLVRALEPRQGDRWLDVATGTGAVARLAARAGADVTGLDLAPDLIATARAANDVDALSIRYDVGDAESMPYDDASFDVVSSTFGVMFAPDHEAAARELARVCRPGGKLGLACWREESGAGDMFRVMRPFQGAPPAGIGNPFAWGDEDHVRALLGDAFELEFAELDCVNRLASSEEAWEIFSTSYGPTKVLADSLDDERRDALQKAWIELFERSREGEGIAHHRLYLRVLGTRRP